MLELAEALLAGRSIDQGTGTSLSPLVVRVDPVVLEAVPAVPEVPVVPVVLDPLVAAALSDRMANSIRPEVGFTITSLIVPRVCPCELFTSAPMSLLARTFC